MEKFYNLIPSETIRNLCKDTNYQLDALQCAYLVWDDSKMPIIIKHLYYDAIMKELEDKELSYFNQSGIWLFDKLREHINLEKTAIERFEKDAEKKVYEINSNMIKLNNVDILGSQYITNTKEKICVYFSCGEVISIDSKSWINNYFRVLYTLSLPVQFQRGDIVRCLNNSSYNEICIFDCICNDFSNDNSMAYVYQIYPQGKVGRTCEKCFKMELVTENLPLKERIYQVLSDCIKGKISPVALLHAHYISMMNYEKRKEIIFPNLDKDCEYVNKLFELKDNITFRGN